MEKDKSINNNKRVKVPTVLQMEAVECGAASLAMILAYFGKYVALEELRQACGVSRDGSKASNLLKAARKYGLEAKGFRKEPQSLRDMQGPMILHWNFNHFLVLEGFNKGKVYLNDPANGPRSVSEEELDQAFTGVVLTFRPGEEFVKSGRKPSIITSLKERLKNSRVAILYLLFVGLALVLPGLVVPVFTKIFLDEILLGGKTDWLRALLYGMGITAFITLLLTWLRQHYLLKLQQKLSLSMSGQYLWHVLRLPIGFFQQRYAGDISSRMDSNDKVAQFISGELATTVLNLVMVVFYFIMMLQYSVVLSLIGVVGAVINIWYLKYVSVQRVDLNRKMMQDSGKFMATSMSGLQIIETLKATGSESDFFAKWSGSQARVLVAQQEMGSVSNILGRLPGFITSATDIFVLGFGGLLIMYGSLTIGSLVAFQVLMSSFMHPVNALVGLGGKLQEMEADMNRLDDVFKYPQDIAFNENEIELKQENCEKLAGFVEIRDLTYGYSPLEPPLIEGFSLKLNPGSRVALVGGSGSGKSTIAKLISGLYQPWSGQIILDEKEYQEIPRSVLNASLSVVDQEISMFSGTVRDNVTLWDKSISEKNIIQAAKDAGIHDDIASRPGGYDTEMAEGGSNFSGGQRQRIEIARALVNNPTILIMDEATSALDPLTEKFVDENIRRRGCTCVIVAHRLSTIRDCDEIIVLENGKIIQRGTHEELKSKEGHYANLINAG